LSKNVRQAGDGGFRSLTMYLATVDAATSMPSLASSLRMRGAPHVTFDLDIFRHPSQRRASMIHSALFVGLQKVGTPAA